METIHVQSELALRLDAPPSAPCEGGFHWVQFTHEELSGDAEPVREVVERLTGVRLFDLHLQDAVNLAHPSFYDGTSDYDLLIFRKLDSGGHRARAPLDEIDGGDGAPARRGRLQEILTTPVTFLVFEGLLLTVCNAGSRSVEQVRARLLDFRARPVLKGGGSVHGEAQLARLPQRPEELMLRLLNVMVDRYLDLRQPLTDRLDAWQRDLLDPRRQFSDWRALLDARIELRRLESLCEEQNDALQELRDAYLEATPEPQQSDAYLVRIADVIEHIGRVLSHARRLEASIETALQLHFAANAHRTNRVMRALTVITAVFAPLTLIAGLWGMNVERIPLAHHEHGFAWLVAGMAALALLLLLLMWALRIIGERPTPRQQRWNQRLRRLWDATSPRPRAGAPRED